MDVRLSVRNGRRVVPLTRYDVADFALVLSGYLERRGSITPSLDGGVAVVRIDSHPGSYTVRADDWKKVVGAIVRGLPVSPHQSVYERTLQVLTTLFDLPGE